MSFKITGSINQQYDTFFWKLFLDKNLQLWYQLLKSLATPITRNQVCCILLRKKICLKFVVVFRFWFSCIILNMIHCILLKRSILSKYFFSYMKHILSKNFAFSPKRLFQNLDGGILYLVNLLHKLLDLSWIDCSKRALKNLY